MVSRVVNSNRELGWLSEPMEVIFTVLYKCRVDEWVSTPLAFSSPELEDLKL